MFAEIPFWLETLGMTEEMGIRLILIFFCALVVILGMLTVGFWRKRWLYVGLAISALLPVVPLWRMWFQGGDVDGWHAGCAMVALAWILICLARWPSLMTPNPKRVKRDTA